jgi:hypothetical protein
VAGSERIISLDVPQRGGLKVAKKRAPSKSPDKETGTAAEERITIHASEDPAPPKMPRTRKRVGSFEWASGPANSRDDTLFVSGNRSRTEWILWVSMPDPYDFFSGKWVTVPRASCPRGRMSVEAAARRLVIGLYRAEIEESGLPRPAIVSGGDVFEREAMNELADAIWGPNSP